MKAKFNDPDNTNFLVDVKLCERSEDQMDHSILESDEVLPGLIPPILTDSIPSISRRRWVLTNTGTDGRGRREPRFAIRIHAA
jgi:hypothetical protein